MQKIILTEQDAQRLEGLLQNVVHAFQLILERRRHSTEQHIMDDLDYDLPEMLVYEMAYELERSMPPGD